MWSYGWRRGLFVTATVCIIAGGCTDDPSPEELRESLGPHGDEATVLRVVAEGDSWRMLAFQLPDGMVCFTVAEHVDGRWGSDSAGCGPRDDFSTTRALWSFEIDDSDEGLRRVWVWQVGPEVAEIEATLVDGGDPTKRETVAVEVSNAAARLGVHAAILAYDPDFHVATTTARDSDGEELWSRTGRRW